MILGGPVITENIKPKVLRLLKKKICISKIT